jgi:hypothetical protein
MCICDPCYNGRSCDLLCTGNGVCVANTCVCRNSSNLLDPGRGFTGPFCEQKTCPSINEFACSGHGSCDTPESQICACDTGYKGAGCEKADCLDDCNGRGQCAVVDVGAGLTEARCFNCTGGYMGLASCDIPCTNGVEIPRNQEVCVCNDCYSGPSCDQLCGGQGVCVDTPGQPGRKECACNDGYRGITCGEPGCPGNKESSCASHGTCNLATRNCTCDDGWTGPGEKLMCL